MKQISPEHTNEILTEMCKRVGVKLEDIDMTKEDWFQAHSWTQEEEDDFRVWLGKFLVQHKYARKGNYRGQNAGYYEAGKLIFNYGWKYK